MVQWFRCTAGNCGEGRDWVFAAADQQDSLRDLNLFLATIQEILTKEAGAVQEKYKDMLHL